jgi:acyl carrier protein
MSATVESLIEVVCLQLGVAEASAGDRLQADLAADSADVLNLVVAVEDRFGITLSEEDIAALVTVADLFRLVQRAERG